MLKMGSKLTLQYVVIAADVAKPSASCMLMVRVRGDMTWMFYQDGSK